MIRDFFIQETGSTIGTDLDTGYFVVVRKDCKIGNNVKIWSHVTIDPGAQIGNNVRVHNHVYVCQNAIIEDDVFIGPGTQLLNDRYPVRTDPECWEPPIIKRGAVVGGGVILCPGVVIGERAVIGGGSVVTRDVPAGEVWVGNPAKHLATLPSDKVRRLR